MTQRAEALVEQVDRDAAAAIPLRLADDRREAIRAGRHDHHPVVQAFAAHRRAALSVVQPELDRLRAVGEAGDALLRAIGRARDMVPDEDEGLAADVFARCLNAAEQEYVRARTTLETAQEPEPFVGDSLHDIAAEYLGMTAQEGEK